MNTPYHLFVVQNDDFDKLQSGYNLPFGDESYFASGFLINKRLDNRNLTDEELEQVRKQTSYLAGRKSLYYFGQTILEDHEPKTDEPFALLDEGYFITTLSGPGYNNTDNHSKFEGDWEKISIKDRLTIKPDFTWERSKETDTGFFLKWNGTYSYSGDLLVFSLSEQGYSGYMADTAENYIPYYGLMYGPIDNTHVIDKPMEGRISGLISGNVSGMIKGPISGMASCVGYGTAANTVGDTLSENQSIVIRHETSAEIPGIIKGTISGIIEEYKEGLGKGTAKDTKISGI
jgi:hypothetical protein